MSTKKKKLKPKKPLINLKVTRKEQRALNLKAKRYAKGNLSLWLRHAGMKHVPKKTERI